LGGVVRGRKRRNRSGKSRDTHEEKGVTKRALKLKLVPFCPEDHFPSGKGERAEKRDQKKQKRSELFAIEEKKTLPARRKKNTDPTIPKRGGNPGQKKNAKAWKTALGGQRGSIYVPFEWEKSEKPDEKTY